MYWPLKLDGYWGGGGGDGKVTLLVQQEMRKRVDWGRSRKDCVGSAKCKDGSHLRKKRKRRGPSTQTSSQSKSRRGMRFGMDMCRERVGMSRAGVAEGMGLQGERVVLISETPSPVFFAVRSVISTPVCGENAHHVVLPAGKLVTDSPTEIHI
jgi:hypothetical protein